MTWHPATDPPSDGRSVILRTENGTRISGYWFQGEFRIDDGERYAITHWHEMPPGPGEPDPAQALAEELAALLCDAKCPTCDGSGAIPTMPDGEPEQCRWCFERTLTLAAYDAQKVKPPTP